METESFVKGLLHQRNRLRKIIFVSAFLKVMSRAMLCQGQKNEVAMITVCLNVYSLHVINVIRMGKFKA